MKALLLLVLSLPAFAQDEPSNIGACTLALIDESEGNAVVVHADGKGGDLTQFESIAPGDLVRTGKDAWVDLRLCDGSGLRVGEQSEFTYVGTSNERESFLNWAFGLVRGSVYGNVAGEGNGERVKLRIKTANAAMGIRGTEFVVESDSSDVESHETALHTLHGEVLMGTAEDFDKLGSLRGRELLKNFEPVGKEQMSMVRPGQPRPLKAAAFKIWEFKAGRKRLLARALAQKGHTEVRERFQKARLRHIERLQQRGIFDRSREKLEKRMENKGEKLLNIRQQNRQDRIEQRKKRRGSNRR